MAWEMNSQSYENMINALRAFAAKTEATSSELASVCHRVVVEFGTQDLKSVAAARSYCEIAGQYEHLVHRARCIADTMEEELGMLSCIEELEDM